MLSAVVQSFDETCCALGCGRLCVRQNGMEANLMNEAAGARGPAGKVYDCTSVGLGKLHTYWTRRDVGLHWCSPRQTPATCLPSTDFLTVAPTTSHMAVHRRAMPTAVTHW